MSVLLQELPRISVTEMKLFQSRTVEELEAAINSWIALNPDISLKHVTQSQCEKQGRLLLVTGLYYEKSGSSA